MHADNATVCPECGAPEPRPPTCARCGAAVEGSPVTSSPASLPEGPGADAAWRDARLATAMYVAFAAGRAAAAVLRAALAHGAGVRREALALASVLAVGGALWALVGRRARWALTAAVGLATGGPALVAVTAVAMALAGRATGPALARAAVSVVAAGSWGVALWRARRRIHGAAGS